MVAFNSRLEGYSRAQLLLKEGIEVIAGGFPCQDISAAGRRAGITGERSGLWREMLRTIRLVRPRYAFVENVAALLYRGMGTVLGDLASSGYDAEWDCISAAEVNAPHLRERIWIVAHTSCFNRGIQSFHSELTDKIKPLKDGTQERMADSNSKWKSQPQGVFSHVRRWIINSCQEICNAPSEGLPDWAGGKVGQPRPITEFERSDGREVEYDFCGMAHGISNRVDRLKALGNAVVPRIPQAIGESIMKLHNYTKGCDNDA